MIKEGKKEKIMVKFLYIMQILSGLLLILLVLLHSPKGDGMGGMMGSASQLFASQKTAEKGLNKVTYIIGGIFIVATLILGLGLIK